MKTPTTHCFWCERGIRRSRGPRDRRPTDATRDHVIPQSHPLYRTAAHGNLCVLSCQRCNCARGDAPAVLFCLFAVRDLRHDPIGSAADVSRRFRAWLLRHTTAPVLELEWA